MRAITNADGQPVVQALIDVIKANRDHLSDIDGLIGDGDHGVNMAKGFSLAESRLAGQSVSLSEAMDTLGFILMSEIGGSMGPLYGNLFIDMAGAVKDVERIDANAFGAMLKAAIGAIQELGEAKVGDKTLMDTLVPAEAAFATAVAGGKSFDDAIDAMSEAAEKGKESTRDLVAKIGRSSRLGERSRGVLDAGAVSCCLLLTTMGVAVKERLTDA